MINVAATGNAINPKATMTDIMFKSLKYMEKIEGKRKEYDKDGAHAHTENEPIGEHNHPELEMGIKETFMDLNQRINFIHERIDDLRTVEAAEDSTGLKSKINKKRGGIMSEKDKDKPDEPSDDDKDKDSEGSDDGDSDEEGDKDSSSSSEQKASKLDSKALGEIKSSIDDLTKEVKELKKKSEEVDAILVKANVKSAGAEDASNKEDLAGKDNESIGPLDNI